MGDFNLLDFDVEMKNNLFLDAAALENLEIFESNAIS
jgi:hypothetical protein